MASPVVNSLCFSGEILPKSKFQISKIKWFLSFPFARSERKKEKK
jgi:hypothetical protein